jgi:hypothetical protein
MLLPILHDRSTVELCGDALGEIWWQGRQWAVTDYGLECRDGCYPIEKERLAEDLERGWSWPQQMGEKTWVDLGDFITAWCAALVLHGIDAGPSDAIREAIRLAIKRN